MEEKILIKSEIDEKAKTLFGVFIALFFFVFALMLLLLFQKRTYGGGYYARTMTGFEGAFKGDGVCLAFLIIGACALVMGVTVLIVFLVNNKCELTVTEKNVRGKAVFGKEVVLPIHMISAYSTRSFMSTISVATSSGLTRFAFIGNYAEIGRVLSQLVNKRQDKTENVAAEPAKASSYNMDDLVKLKALLDQGIITQEEFEIKKKQILGL